MAETLFVEIVTPERAVFTGTVSEVVLPGVVGEMGVLPGHLPLLTAIAMGDLAVVQDNKTRHFFVEGGYAEILPNKVSVLTEACDGIDEIDVSTAKKALETAEKQLLALEERSRAEEIEGDVRKAHEEALERARRRLLMAEGDKH